MNFNKKMSHFYGKTGHFDGKTGHFDGKFSQFWRFLDIRIVRIFGQKYSRFEYVPQNIQIVRIGIIRTGNPNLNAIV